MTSCHSMDVRIGVLALQGAIEEHVDCIQRAGATEVTEIKLPKDLIGLDGIILPGGESTAMAVIGNEFGLFPFLKEWVQSNKPCWGTCAGMILLSDHAIKQKEGGQSLVGGLDVHVCRNFFGPQLNSCKIDVTIPENLVGMEDSNTVYPGVFIRAPAILKIGPSVQELCRINAMPHVSARAEVENLLSKEYVATADEGSVGKLHENGSVDVIIAAKQNNILVTAFHPELTQDLRWHRYFVELVRSHKSNELLK